MSGFINISFKNLPAPGDKKEFGIFFKKYYPKLAAYACLFLEPELAEDVVQDLFVNIWENAETIKVHTSLEAYLFKAVYLRCLNQLKQRKSRNNHHKLIQDYLMAFESRLFDPDTNNALRKLYMDELRDDINKAIDSLPEKCREVFMLSYIHDLKNKEISELLGVSQSTVENHVYNALKALRKKLAKHTHILFILFPF
jgi:RNA polymerase sigma-70 factor, ECF subfamily